MLYGVDVSNYQSDIQFSNIPADFAIVKATGGPGYVNPHWAAQSQRAQNAGLLVGLYHFSGDGWTGTTPEQEADFYLNTIGPRQAGHALVLDFEASVGQWPIAYPDWAIGFCRRVTQRTGRKPWVYANGQALGYGLGGRLAAEGYPLWHAYYTDRPISGYNPDVPRPTAGGYGQAPMWQFTQYGRLPGYGANLDLNVFYGDRNDWNRLAGLTGAQGDLLIPGVSGLFK